MPTRLAPADLALILALVRGGTLAGAAARLQVDASTVFRTIRRIERDIGERLFERGRHGYRATELGRELAAHGERIEAALQDAREAAFHGAGEVAGTLRITTTDTLLHCLLLPVLERFAAAHPAVQLELVATNAVADLSRRDADIAIRATRTPPAHLVGVKLGALPAAVYAASSWLDRVGRPPDLAQAGWIALDDSIPDHPSVRWRRSRHPKSVPRLRCNSVLSVAGAVIHGLGAGVVPLFVMRGQAGVEIVEGPLEELETELWVLAHPEVRHLQRVKALFAFLRDNLVL